MRIDNTETIIVKNAAIISLRGISVYSSSSFLKSTQASLLVNQFYLLESIPVFRSGWYGEEQKKVQLNNNTQINKVKKPSVSWPTSKNHLQNNYFRRQTQKLVTTTLNVLTLLFS